MTKGEVLAMLAGSPEAELGDTLMQLTAAYWLEQGCSPDEIEFLLEEVLEESGGSPNGDDEG